MKSNSKAVKEKIRAHILACVYDVAGNPFQTVRDAATWLAVEFDRVANHPHNVKRFPNEQDRFQDYLMGLPFNFEYTHAGIADTLNGWGINPTGKEYAPDKSARLYAALIFREMNACKG